MKDNFSVRDWKNKTLFKEYYEEGEDSTQRVLPKSFADQERTQIEKDANKAMNRIGEANEDYDLLKIKKDIRFHLDAYESGTIDGDDLAQAVEEVVFGKIVAPGMNSDADFEAERRYQMGMREEDEPSARDIKAAEKDLDFEIPKSTGDSNNMRDIIVKKVAKIEKKRDNNEDFSMDMLALKQYIKKDEVRKEVGASEIRNLVSSLIK